MSKFRCILPPTQKLAGLSPWQDDDPSPAQLAGGLSLAAGTGLGLGGAGTLPGAWRAKQEADNLHKQYSSASRDWENAQGNVFDARRAASDADWVYSPDYRARQALIEDAYAAEDALADAALNKRRLFSAFEDAELSAQRKGLLGLAGIVGGLGLGAAGIYGLTRD